MAQVTISRDERRFAPVKTLPHEQVVKTPTSTEVTSGTSIKFLANFLWQVFYSVQAVVEKVKEDFHKLYYSNEKLRRTVGQKVCFSSFIICTLMQYIETKTSSTSKKDRRVLHTTWISWHSSLCRRKQTKSFDFWSGQLSRRCGKCNQRSANTVQRRCWRW